MTALCASAASAQPRFEYTYAAKFVCGASDGPIVAPGTYFTAINVHNPRVESIPLRKKFAVALPAEQPGPVSKFFDAKLGPDQAFEIDCPDILRHLAMQPPARFVKGFAVIESPVRLDVVVVYTAAGATRRVETLFIERVPGERSAGPALPDLLPRNPDPTKGPLGYCRRRELILTITIQNQGPVDAAASTTRVLFQTRSGPVSQDAATPPIPASGSVDVQFTIPPTCFQPDCAFTITADATGALNESNEMNNVAEGLCKG